MKFETSAGRLWRRLAPADRVLAAGAFWSEPGEELGGGLAAIIKARRLRPQVARRLDDEARTRILATVLEPGEGVAAALLVALHVHHRREMLAAFLDALGLPHEDGVLKESREVAALDAARLGAAVAGLAARWSAETIRCYLNTLWLQDPGRWAGVEAAYEAWESAATSTSPSEDTTLGGSSSQ